MDGPVTRSGQARRGTDVPDGEAARLTPTMSSRKLQALDFIKRYFAQWGHSPTYGELGAALGVSSKRAHDLVHSLSRERMIEHVAGKPRGIRLIDRTAELGEADVLLLLARFGVTVFHGAHVLMPAAGAVEPEGAATTVIQALTEKGLHALPHLDHEGPSEPGLGTNDEDEQIQRRSAR